MDNNQTTITKPESVAQAQSILYFCFIVSSAEFVYRLFTKEPSGEFSIECIALIGAFVALAWLFTIYQIGNGKNWARYFYAITFALLSFRTLYLGFHTGLFYEPTFWGLRKMVEIMGITLLFYGESRYWFGDRKLLVATDFCNEQNSVGSLEDKEISISENSEAPLYILKYKLHSHGLASTFMFFFIVLTLFVFVRSYITDDASSKLSILHSLTLIAINIMFLENILFKEIIIYRNRIIKNWRIIGGIEVKFKEASLFSTRFGFTRIIKIYKTHDTTLRKMFKGVIIYNTFTGKEDFQKVLKLLAEISGRNVFEFDRCNFEMNPFLIKGDHNG